MYFDLRNHSSSSDRFDSAGRLAISVVSVDEWLSFRHEFRRKDESANCEIPAVPSDHCLSDFGYLNEEGVFRPFFISQLQLLRRSTLLSSLRNISRWFSSELGHHECPERWCSPDEGSPSNSSRDVLSHSRSATRRRCSSWSACRRAVALSNSACASAPVPPRATSRRAHSSSISVPPRALSFFSCISLFRIMPSISLCRASIRCRARSSSAASSAVICGPRPLAFTVMTFVRCPGQRSKPFSRIVTGSARRAHGCVHHAGRAEQRWPG